MGACRSPAPAAPHTGLAPGRGPPRRTAQALSWVQGLQRSSCCAHLTRQRLLQRCPRQGGEKPPPSGLRSAGVLTGQPCRLRCCRSQSGALSSGSASRRAGRFLGLTEVAAFVCHLLAYILGRLSVARRPWKWGSSHRHWAGEPWSDLDGCNAPCWGLRTTLRRPRMCQQSKWCCHLLGADQRCSQARPRHNKVLATRACPPR